MATAAGWASNATSHSSAVRDAEALNDLFQHGAVPLAVRQFEEALWCRIVETTVVHVEQPTQLAPALRAAEVDHDGPAVGGVEDAQDRRLGVADDPGSVPLAMEDGGGVEEEQRIEQRRLDVLAVAGRGALDQRGTGAQDGDERGADTGDREGEPDRVVAREQSLLRAAGRARVAPSRAVT